jgi:hypothetical protein
VNRDHWKTSRALLYNCLSFIETQVRALEKEIESLQREKELIKHQYKFAEKTRIKSGQVCLSIHLHMWILVRRYGSINGLQLKLQLFMYFH